MTGDRKSPVGPPPFDGGNGVGQAVDDLAENGNPLFDDLRRKQVTATFIAATAFSGFAACDTQRLRELLAEAAPVAFFDVGAHRIKTSDQLFDEFTAPIIAPKNS